MSEKVTVLGIDAGSVSVGTVEMDTAGNVRQTGYRFHRGHVAETIREIHTEFNTKTVVDIGATISTPEIVSRAKRIDNRIVVIAGARRFHRSTDGGRQTDGKAILPALPADITEEPQPRYNDTAEAILAAYGLRIEHTGEAMENLLKIHHLSTHYPDLSMFVQTSPAFCCPSLVTEAFNDAIEEKTGCPVVTIIYDGTGGCVRP